MQTTEYLANFSCSKQFSQGLDNQIISFSAINTVLGIAAIVGNTVILIALHKETSLHQPSKVLLCNLVASDLCVGFLQLVFGAHWISILKRQWQICRLLYFILRPSGAISIAVSLGTMTATGVDRLLALLLKFRYRQVVTLRKVYAVAIASLVWNGIGFATYPAVFHSNCNESILCANHSSVLIYIRVLLHQDFFQTASPTQPSLKYERSRESTTSSRYSTMQKDGVQRSVAAVSNANLLFPAFVDVFICAPKN